MKKLLCMFLAVLSIGCLAGCVDHDDDICDKCEKEETVLNPVETWIDAKEELCAECALEKYAAEYGDALEKAIQDAMRD